VQGTLPRLDSVETILQEKAKTKTKENQMGKVKAKSLRQLAKELGVSHSYLSQVKMVSDLLVQKW
jgi:hypothetical protein